MLAYQTLKLNTHNIVVINNDGTKLLETYKFDRILCDVPCSGDGTVRKNDGSIVLLLCSKLILTLF